MEGVSHVPFGDQRMRDPSATNGKRGLVVIRVLAIIPPPSVQSIYARNYVSNPGKTRS